jgi:hypothetical protein
MFSGTGLAVAIDLGRTTAEKVLNSIRLNNVKQINQETGKIGGNLLMTIWLLHIMHLVCKRR